MLQQVAYGELGAAEVVGDHGHVVDGLGPLVQQHHAGVPGVDLGRGKVVQRVRDEDEAGDPHAEEGPQIVDLALAHVSELPTRTILPRSAAAHSTACAISEEGLAGVRDDQPMSRCAARPSPGRRGRAGTQFLDGGEDTLARGRGDRPGPLLMT